MISDDDAIAILKKTAQGPYRVGASYTCIVTFTKTFSGLTRPVFISDPLLKPFNFNKSFPDTIYSSFVADGLPKQVGSSMLSSQEN